VLSGLGLAGAIGALVSRVLPGGRVSANLGGVRVEHWGCQYQNINIEQIVGSELDMIVIDPVVQGERLLLDQHPGLKRKPNGARRLVLAYLSIGEAESYRDYWQPTWKEQAPEWLGPENPRWPGSFAVHYWHAGWRDMLLRPGGAIDRIVEAGFDGVFLDRVDAYGDWPRLGVKAQQDMIDLVTTLSSNARGRREKFLVVAQNAEPLLMNEGYCASISAVSKESLLYNLQGPGRPNTDSDIEWSLNYLKLARARQLPVLAIEYLEDLESQFMARERLAALGFVPFFGHRLLDKIPA
jgi:cysteinyl-tRNA synthetase